MQASRLRQQVTFCSLASRGMKGGGESRGKCYFFATTRVFDGKIERLVLLLLSKRNKTTGCSFTF